MWKRLTRFLKNAAIRRELPLASKHVHFFFSRKHLIYTVWPAMFPVLYRLLCLIVMRFKAFTAAHHVLPEGTTLLVLSC